MRPQSPSTSAASSTSASPDVTAQTTTTVLPLIEERLDVAIERAEVGALRVRIVVDETVQAAEVELVSTEVRPMVVPCGVEVDARREPYLDNDELVVPVYEERPVVVLKLFLKEEVRLTRIRHEQQQSLEVPLRRERAVVERQQPDGSWRAEPGMQPGTPVADRGT